MADKVNTCIRAFSAHLNCEIIEINARIDRVYLLAMVPPKVALSDYVGTTRGRTAIRVLNKFRYLKEKPYWGNHSWSSGYCVDTVGLDSEMIQKYVKHREAKEKTVEQNQGNLL